MEILASRTEIRRGAAILFWSVMAALTAGLVVYSQTMAFAWDEGFHLLIAQLIKHGKRPYIDFVFSQPPLNAYWNAAWMTILGESWRPVHLVAALCSAGAVILTAGFVLSRFPVAGWRLAAALFAGAAAGLNAVVVRFGGIAQAYGLCLIAIVSAYRLVVVSVERKTVTLAALAGFLSGVAAGSSLLTAPAGPVLLIWVLIYNLTGSRWAKAAAFLLGEAVAFLPIVWLFVQGPRQVFFGIIQYNFLYRKLDWPDASGHNLEVMGLCINYGPALLLLLLAAGGLLFIRYRSDWDARRKAEFYLCAWLSAALAAMISSAVPTFARYYLLTVPFLSILAAAGIYAAGSALYDARRPWRPVLVVTFLFGLGLASTLFDERDDLVWPDLEKAAAKVASVVTPEQALFADEAVYFLTRHTPPSGMEMVDSHKFDLPPALSSQLHLIPKAELDRRVKAGAFAALETCEEEEEDIQKHGYASLYAKSTSVGDCKVFWDRKPSPPPSAGK
jgi:hypothetical protein